MVVYGGPKYASENNDFGEKSVSGYIAGLVQVFLSYKEEIQLYLTYSEYLLRKTMVIFLISFCGKYIFQKQRLFALRHKMDNTYFRNKSRSLANFLLYPHNYAKSTLAYFSKRREILRYCGEKRGNLQVSKIYSFDCARCSYLILAAIVLCYWAH